MVALAQPIAKIALTFSTPEYFAMIFFGLVSVGSLGGGSLTNAFISLFFGLLISTVASTISTAPSASCSACRCSRTASTTWW